MQKIFLASIILLLGFLSYHSSQSLSGHVVTELVSCKVLSPIGEIEKGDVVYRPRIEVMNGRVLELNKVRVDGKPATEDQARLHFYSREGYIQTSENSEIILIGEAVQGYAEGKHKITATIKTDNGNCKVNIPFTIYASEPSGNPFDAVMQESLVLPESEISQEDFGNQGLKSVNICSLPIVVTIPYFGVDYAGLYPATLKASDLGMIDLSAEDTLHLEGKGFTQPEVVIMQQYTADQGLYATYDDNGQIWNSQGLGRVDEVSIAEDGTEIHTSRGVAAQYSPNDKLTTLVKKYKQENPLAEVVIFVDFILDADGTSYSAIGYHGYHDIDYNFLVIGAFNSKWTTDGENKDVVEKFILQVPVDKLHKYSQQRIGETLAHEMGHAMGLGHNALDKHNVMCTPCAAQNDKITESQSCLVRIACRDENPWKYGSMGYYPGSYPYLCGNNQLEAHHKVEEEGEIQGFLQTNGLNAHFHINCDKDDPLDLNEPYTTPEYVPVTEYWGQHSTPYELDSYTEEYPRKFCQVEEFCGDGVIDASLGETCEKDADCKPLDDCVDLGNGLCQQTEAIVEQTCGGTVSGITYHCVCIPQLPENGNPLTEGFNQKETPSCYEHTLPHLDQTLKPLSGGKCQDDCWKMGPSWKCVSTSDSCHCQYAPFQSSGTSEEMK